MTIDMSVNYLAVLVAGIASGIIGFLYYGVTGLGDRWMTMVGRPVRNGPPPLASMAVGLAAGLVNAWVLALLSLNLGASSLIDAALLGILIWLGFMATLSAATVGFEGRPWSLWLLNNVHHLILQVVIAVIVTLWR